MHKSALTLSLFLMGTLILLLPFTSINFSNVKAQEYGTYDDDMYSTYPTNVNKYECQKGPFEGFFVSSVEFCLSKISPNPPLVNTFNCIDNNNINTNEANDIRSSGAQQQQQQQQSITVNITL